MALPYSIIWFETGYDPMSIIAEDDPRLVFIPIENAQKATGLCDIRDNYWCLVHPTKGIILWQLERKRHGNILGSILQGNRTRSITQMVQQKLYPWAEVQLIERVIIPIDVRDYA